jgi:DNA-directed RNA polymerase subunit RPC12/RpoP
MSDPADPASPAGTPEPVEASSVEAQLRGEKRTEAEYMLESPVRCPACGERMNSVNAVRLLRTQVNFTSTLPRRGRVVTCPHCFSVIPAELTNF